MEGNGETGELVRENDKAKGNDGKKEAAGPFKRFVLWPRILAFIFQHYPE